MATSKEVRVKIGHMVNKQQEVDQEIKELLYDLREKRWEKRRVETDMVELFATEKFYYLLKVDKKTLHHFLEGDKL